MNNIKATKRDIIWSYLAHFFNLGVGFITLPAVLKMLNADEVGLNYILVSINSIIVLFDMGFSSQFARNITYVLSGAQTVEKEGISTLYQENVNEKLLASILTTAKRMYRAISWIAMIPLLTLGTYYVWKVTNNGTSINNIIYIWSVFCISCFFNLYFLYYNSFLQGRGMIKEAKQGQIISRIIQIVVLLTMLFCGCGLLSVVVANLVAPFAFRYYANFKFFDKYINKIIKANPISSGEIKEIFIVLLYNAKKMGIIGILANVILYATTLIVGVFLPLDEVGSYGVMIQLLGIIGGLSTILFYSMTPELSQYLVKKQYAQLRERFGLAIFLFICIQLLGLMAMMVAPFFFRLFGFGTQLPSTTIIVLFFIYRFVEQNQSLYSQLLLLENNLIFYKSAIWSCLISIFLLFILLYLGFGFYGIFFAEMIPLCAYTAWKWPIYSTKKFGINTKRDIFQHSFEVIHNNWNRYLHK